MAPMPFKRSRWKTSKDAPRDGALNARGNHAPTKGAIWRHLRIERLRITDKAALHPVVRELS